MVTGEPMPVDEGRRRRPSSARTINQTGRLPLAGDQGRARTRCSPRSSGWSSEAQGSKAPIQRLADRRRELLRAAVVFVAIGRPSSSGSTSGPSPALTFALVSAVAVLIIACPCALGPGDAAVDHGRHRQGRRGRRPDPLGRGAGDRAQARHDGPRQDRHDHRGQAGADRRRHSDGGGRRGRAAPPGRVGRALARSIRWRAAIVAGAEERGSPSPRPSELRVRHRARGRGHRRRAARSLVGNARLLAERGVDAGARSTSAAERLARRARPRSSSPSTAPPPGVIAVADTDQGRTPRAPSRRCTASASRSS